MNTFLYSLFFLATSLSATSLNDPQKLVAVSHSGIASILYRHIRRAIPNGVPRENINSDSKRRICHYLTERNFFGYQSRVQMYKIYNELRRQYADIFDMLYEKSTKSNTSISRTSDYVVYTNPIRSITVVTVGPHYLKNFQPDETVPEFAFLCLARGPRLIRPYFVSMEYNVSDSPSTYIAGRFVFRHRGHGKATIYALAEEPATTLSTPGIMVEEEYLKRKKMNSEQVAKESEDPLCTLDENERLRVCTLVMNAKYFEEELEFPSLYTAVDNSFCRKREIVFRGEKSELEINAEEAYEEWMITCRPDPNTVYATYQFEYFLSRAYKPNEVFVYRRTDDDETKLFIENLFGNVRFKMITTHEQVGTSAVLEHNKNKRSAEVFESKRDETDDSYDGSDDKQSAKKQKKVGKSSIK